MSKVPPVTKTFRVTFTDAARWEAFFQATNREEAIEVAQACWANGGTDGFDPEHRLEVCEDGLDWAAEEVEPQDQDLEPQPS